MQLRPCKMPFALPPRGQCCLGLQGQVKQWLLLRPT